MVIKKQQHSLPLVNGNPDWRSVMTLASFFQLIDEATDGAAEVHMMNGHCKLENSLCGAPACHAGWFGMYFDNHNDSIPYMSSSAKNFDHYAKEMAAILGFLGDLGLIAWAGYNPHLWGNAHGSAMFCSRIAFGIPVGGNITLKHIYEHWYGVADRLRKLQAGAQ